MRDRKGRRLRDALRSPRAALFRLAARTGSVGWTRAATLFPVTFTDKVRYKMARDRRTLIADFADKARAKAYVRALAGPRYVVEPVAVYDDVAEIGAEGLPEEFVIKVTHASGGVVFVRADAPADARLPAPGGPHTTHAVRRNAFDIERAKAVFAAWLTRAYGVGKGEWAYGVHRPRILIEPLLRTASGGVPRDVKFWVLNGRCVSFRIDSKDVQGGMSDRHFRADGTPLDVREVSYNGKIYPMTEPPPALPTALDEMISVAQRLGEETDFVRVDMMDLDDRFVVGELTNYPSSGSETFVPRSFDRRLGRLWRLPAHYD